MKLAGIDIGTTTISGIVLETGEGGEMTVLESRTVSNGSFVESKNKWERIQDAKTIVEKAKALLDDILARYPVERVGLTGQMHGIVYVNKEGKSISPLYTWQDERSAALDGAGNQSLIEKIQRTCHLKVPAGYGLATHIYNLEHELVDGGACSFCTIMDYFGMYLTGRKTPLVHVSNGAGFGFFDVEKGVFRKELLEKMHVDVTLLPQITSDIAVLGDYRGIPVMTAIGDNQASFLGAAGMEEGAALINMGTGGQISVLSDVCFAAEGVEARPFLQGKYLLVGASLCGGKAYAVLENFFRSYLDCAIGQSEPQYEVMEKLAEEGMLQANPMQVRTTFDGTRSDGELTGEISNLTSRNFTPQGMTYGVLCGMSRELYEFYRQIKERTGAKKLKLVGSGNGIRKNKVLCQIIEEMFGARLTMAACSEEAAAGAAVSTLYMGQ